MTFIIVVKIIIKVKKIIVNPYLDTFDQFVDDLLSLDVNLLNGELDLLLMEHLFQSNELEVIPKIEAQNDDYIAA